MPGGRLDALTPMCPHRGRERSLPERFELMRRIVVPIDLVVFRRVRGPYILGCSARSLGVCATWAGSCGENLRRYLDHHLPNMVPGPASRIAPMVARVSAEDVSRGAGVEHGES